MIQKFSIKMISIKNDLEFFQIQVIYRLYTWFIIVHHSSCSTKFVLHRPLVKIWERWTKFIGLVYILRYIRQVCLTDAVCTIQDFQLFKDHVRQAIRIVSKMIKKVKKVKEVKKCYRTLYNTRPVLTQVETKETN